MKLKYKILVVCAVFIIICISGVWGRYAVKNSNLQGKLESCTTASTVAAQVYYDGILTDTVIFDLQGQGHSGARRIDPVHLLMQFGANLTYSDANVVALAKDGEKLFFISIGAFKSLSSRYEEGSRMYAIGRLPPKLRAGYKQPSFTKHSGSGLYATKDRMETVNKFIDSWVDY